MHERLRKIQQTLRERKLSSLLVTHLPNVRYLTGFSGTTGLCVVGEEGNYFLTDFRYKEQSEHEITGFKIIIAKDSLFEELQKRRIFRGAERVGVEGNFLPYAEFQKLRRLFKRVRFVPQAELVESVSSIKDEKEIALIRAAARISDRVFQDVLGVLKPGVRELEVSAEISYLHKFFGAEHDAFETIVASGARGALPHGVASTKKIRRGEFVTLDFGCVYRGYCCDITRTVAVGEPGKKLREVYRVVQDAQMKAIEAAKAGVVAKDLDAVARRHIERSGYGRHFGHSLGHGIGLQVHEPPRISWMSSYRLQRGNVITIEPGIYLPGTGGVRIEDDILVLNGKSIVLNKAPKELLLL
jgi:Xaa-Pro aminopeptidase